MTRLEGVSLKVVNMCRFGLESRELIHQDGISETLRLIDPRNAGDLGC